MLGILSLITWALIIIVTLKYVVVVMRADNRGEGGVLALMALVSRAPAIAPRRRRFYLMLGMLGAALFYGDCLLTPGDLGAERRRGPEGRDAGASSRWCCRSRIGVLVGLFAVQRFGTARVGRWFGPITLVWFVVLFVLGLQPDRRTSPQILRALLAASRHRFFALHHGVVAFVALGAVMLAVTGAEALYADMGHFGRKPIRMAWLGSCCRRCSPTTRPGRAAARRPERRSRIPFFRLAPDWALYPLVVLATVATVIASQATISGAFSMAQQAVLLGLLPARAHPAHLGQRVRPDLRAGGQLAAAVPASSCWCWASGRRPTSPPPTASPSPAPCW